MSLAEKFKSVTDKEAIERRIIYSTQHDRMKNKSLKQKKGRVNLVVAWSKNNVILPVSPSR